MNAWLKPVRALIVAITCAAPLPAGAAEALPLTHEAELRLAAEICATAWQESAATDYYARRHLLVPLAAADPKRAQGFVAAAPANQRPELRALVLKGLGDAEAAEAAETALAQEGLVPWEVIETARKVVARDKAGAKALLNKALDAFHKQNVGWMMGIGLGQAAAVAKALGDPRMPELVAEVERIAPEILTQSTAQNRAGEEHDWWGTYRCVAEALATVDPDAGLRLVEKIPDAAHRERILLTVVADEIAKVDPARALQLLDTHPLRPEGDPNAVWGWSHTGRQVALALAKQDPAAAEALARRLPRAEDRAETLAALALTATADRVASLRKDALDAAGAAEPYQAAETLARLAELLPPGAQRANTCARALESTLKDERPDRGSRLAARVAFTLSAMDPQGARALLEDALAGCRQDEGQGRERFSVALAFTAIDPARAVEVAKGIPAADADARFDALRKIAQYLVATPEVRAGIRFDRWAASDTWTPGEDVGW